MQWFDFTGYIASALVVVTFYMNDMTSLRVAAIFSNIAFLAYGISLELGPVISLHATLLPLNAWRLMQARGKQAARGRHPVTQSSRTTRHGSAPARGRRTSALR